MPHNDRHASESPHTLPDDRRNPPARRPPPLAFGDLQGCREPFKRLLRKLAPTDDTPLWFAGDLINRGPESLAHAARRDRARQPRATVVLGNHDLNLLAVAAGLRKSKKGDTLDEILAAKDADDLIDWVRHKPLAHFENGMLMVHAGVLPQWDVDDDARTRRTNCEQALRGPNWKETLASLYGNEPHRWDDSLTGADRLRVTYNALSRIRFCTAEGAMEFANNGGPDAAPPGYMPWFDVPGRRTQDVTVVFGHWAALGLMIRDDVMCLDSGCVWGEQAVGGAARGRPGGARRDAGQLRDERLTTRRAVSMISGRLRHLAAASPRMRLQSAAFDRRLRLARQQPPVRARRERFAHIQMRGQRRAAQQRIERIAKRHVVDISGRRRLPPVRVLVHRQTGCTGHDADTAA